jgi:prophage regulatory protein
MAKVSVLPEIGYLRLNQIIGNRSSDLSAPPLIPVSRSTWWAGVKTGIFPKPIKLSPGVTVWRVEDIRSFIERNGVETPQAQG